MDELDEEINKIVSFVGSFLEYQKSFVPLLIANANNIIANRSKNALEIEITLENLASMMDVKGVKATFTKLYNYYESIDKESARYALKCYKETYDIKDNELILRRK